MLNIRKEPCGGWIVLFMVVSFIRGCVDRMCQSFLSRCVFFSFAPTIAFGFVVVDFFTFSCLWEISFSSQIVESQLVIGLA